MTENDFLEFPAARREALSEDLIDLTEYLMDGEGSVFLYEIETPTSFVAIGDLILVDAKPAPKRNDWVFVILDGRGAICRYDVLEHIKTDSMSLRGVITYFIRRAGGVL